jgi:hypothetical protein
MSQKNGDRDRDPVSPELIAERAAIAKRVLTIASDHGWKTQSAVAERLGTSRQTVHDWLCGIAIPDRMILEFLVLTGASPTFLLRGTGPMYRDKVVSPTARRFDAEVQALEQAEIA